MRLLTRLSGVVLVGFLGSGCTYLSPVNLDATPADLELLVGEWHGEYESVALNRGGTIDFKLESTGAQAHGDVLMVPSGSGQPYEPTYYGTEPPEQAPDPFRSRVLTIRFVRAYGGSISGDLDPYWDPDSNCEARSTFRGHLEVGKMEGTFTTRFGCAKQEATEPGR
jgi:hypothetical protein